MSAIPRILTKIHPDDGYQEDEMPPSQFEERMRALERKVDVLIERFDQHDRWAGEKATELALTKASAEKVVNEVDKYKSNVRLLLVVGGLLCTGGGWLVGWLFK